MHKEENEIELKDILRVFKKKWLMILLPAVVIAGLAHVFLVLQPNVYESYAIIRIGRSGTGQFESVDAINEIMSSGPMFSEICTKAGVGPGKFTKIDFKEASGYLKIIAKANSPEMAVKLVQVSSDMLLKRHTEFYKHSQERIKNAVLFVKETIKPVPISSGINEFMLEPTSVLVPAVFDSEPKDSDKIAKPLLVFFLVCFVDLLIAIYVERRKE